MPTLTVGTRTYEVSDDLPLMFHPAAIRASAVDTPSGAVRATGKRRSWSGLRSLVQGLQGRRALCLAQAR
jgi:hypothetical protein